MPSIHCRICKRPLSDYTSVKIGMGPVCRCRENRQPCFDFLHAVFSVIEVKPNFILIKDTGHMDHKTISNDVEWVLSQLAQEYNLQYRRIFYIDSAGDIDEIIHNGMAFHGFKHGHEGVAI